MALTFEWHIIAGAVGASTVNPATGGNATNWNMMYTNAYDSTGTAFRSTTNRIPVPAAGNRYSYERWIKGYWSGAANEVRNIKVYKSSGSMSDAALKLYGGTTAAYATPVGVSTASGKALTLASSWDATNQTMNITPTGGISSFPGWSKYFITQLKVPSTVTTPGDIGSQVITILYDES